MIQKTATIEESEGELDKDSAPLTDRAASLDISKKSSAIIEGSGVEDVDAEGVRIFSFRFYDNSTIFIIHMNIQI